MTLQYDLSNVADLKTYIDIHELRYNHDQMSDVLQLLDQDIEHYTRLRSMVQRYLAKDPGLTTSLMIGPFLKLVARAISDEPVGLDEESS